MTKKKKPQTVEQKLHRAAFVVNWRHHGPCQNYRGHERGEIEGWQKGCILVGIVAVVATAMITSAIDERWPSNKVKHDAVLQYLQATTPIPPGSTNLWTIEPHSSYSFERDPYNYQNKPNSEGKMSL